jgi:TATA-box binding protein (TBP) (component of TFIID and TFIIIB)
MVDTIQENNGDKLVFPEFKNIKVSTKTFTAMTNLTINIKRLFETLPVTPFIVIPKKRGRKKKCEVIDPNKDIEEGSIITIKHEGNLRGVERKPKKRKNKNKKKWFRNSITVVIVFDKPINFKVCRNGTFQMTGCKKHEHAELCIKYIWKYIKDNKEIYDFTRGDKLETLFIPSMRNIDFSLGFLVDREKLNKYMISQKDFHCLLETSFGYTGVNIKIPIVNDITKLVIKKLVHVKDNIWVENMTTYTEYLDMLPEKDKNLKLKHVRYNTFLVFHSGKVIMSGLTSEFMEDIYLYFISIMRKCYDKIEERLEI